MPTPKRAKGRGMEDEARRRPLDRLLRREDTPAHELARARKPVAPKRRTTAVDTGQGMEEEAKRRSLDQRLRKKTPSEAEEQAARPPAKRKPRSR